WAALTRPKRVICCSQFAAKSLWKLYPGIARDVVYAPVAPAPVTSQVQDSSQRLAVRKELETPEDAVVILQVSRMEPWKGHRLHLEALATMRELPGWMCCFAGGAQRAPELRYLEELKRTAARHG